jgi:hypothetical protein
MWTESIADTIWFYSATEEEIKEKVCSSGVRVGGCVYMDVNVCTCMLVRVY